MKTKTFLLTLITISFISKFGLSQNNKDWEWAPLGAVWMYATGNMNFENPENSMSYGMYWFVQSAKDTIINETLCRKLEVTRFSRPNFAPVKMPSRYTYQDGGDIYFYNQNVNDFTLAFSYDIDYGDTVAWESPYFEDLICDFYLDTIINWDAGFLSAANTPYMIGPGTLHSNTPISSYRLYIPNYSYPLFYCRYLGYQDGLMYGIGQYYDYLGTWNDLFMHFYNVEGGSHNVCCYYDGVVNISYARFHPSEYVPGYAQDSCVNYFYRNLINSNERIDLKNKFTLSPNPATDFVQINSHSSHSFSYEIYNMHGKLIKVGKDYKFNTSIDISTLTQGIYLIHLITENHRKVRRIIKIW